MTRTLFFLSVLVAGCSGGRSGGDAGPDTGWMPPAHCTGLELRAPGVLDLDVPLVTISGRITVDGRPLSPTEVSAARLELHERDDETIFHLSSPNVRPDGSFDLDVPPGRYDVRWVGLASCDAQPGLPCNAGVVRSDLALASPGVLDLDLATARIEAYVTTGGVPASRGLVVLSPASSESSARVPIEVGVADARLLRGRYEVAYEHSDCTGPEPCGRHVLGSIDLQTDGVFDLPVPRVHVTGTLRIDGAPPEGAIDVWLRAGAHRVSVDATGVWDATLVPAVYDIGVEAPFETCRVGGRLPCVPARIRAALPLMADGALDLDAATIDVTGAVSVNGVPTPAGRLRIHGDEGGGTGPTGAWGARLVPGVYSISFEGEPGGCTGGAAPAIPCNGGVVLSPRSLAADGVLDLDVRAVHVSGAATPAPGSGPASLELVPEGDATPLRIAVPTGAYAVTLVAGRYAVDWSSRPGGCERVRETDCLEVRAHAGVDLSADGVLDVPVATFEVQGTFRLAGLAPPPGAPGWLALVGTDGASLAHVAVDAAGGFRLPLAAGRWVIAYEPDDFAVCDGLGGPCGDTIAAGCR
jgi:hypothetical protein